MNNCFNTDLNIDINIINYVNKISKEIIKVTTNLEEIEEYNQLKVLDAFRSFHLSSSDFSWTTGYGHGDFGREKLEKIYAKIFKAKDALVRQEITCGTHAISVALQGMLLPGDEFIYITGKPYDTLLKVIGLEGDEKGTLLDYGIKYKEVPLKNNEIDIEEVLSKINKKNKIISYTKISWI